MINPWWQFLSDTPKLEEERKIVWQTIPKVDQSPSLCRLDPREELSEKRMLESQPISSCIMANQHTAKLIQVFHPTMYFLLHVIGRVLEMGVIQHCKTLTPGKGQSREMLKLTGWNLMDEAKHLPQFDECPTPFHSLIMNIIV